MGAKCLDTPSCPRSCPGTASKWVPDRMSPLPEQTGPGRAWFACSSQRSSRWGGWLCRLGRAACRGCPCRPSLAGGGRALLADLGAALFLTDETRGLPGEHGAGRPGGREGAGPGAEGGAHPRRGPGRARVRALQVPGPRRPGRAAGLGPGHLPPRPGPGLLLLQSPEGPVWPHLEAPWPRRPSGASLAVSVLEHKWCQESLGSASLQGGQGGRGGVPSC